MKKSKKTRTESMIDAVRESGTQFVRLAIYPAGSGKGELTYRGEPCDISPTPDGRYSTDYPSSREEYDTDGYRIRWGKFRFLKRNGRFCRDE